MSETESAGKLPAIFRDIALAALLFTLPMVNIFLPALVVLLIGQRGFFTGNRILLCGITIACCASIFVSSLLVMLFSMTLLACGYLLSWSAARNETPAVALGKSLLLLAVLWITLLSGLANFAGVEIYATLTASFQNSMDEAISYYLATASDTPQTQAMVVAALTQTQRLLPLVLPGLLLSPAIAIPWLTMLLVGRFEDRFGRTRTWPDFQYWRIPEWFIWPGIACALLLTIASDGLLLICINALLLTGILYGLQGLALLLFFFDKWRISAVVKMLVFSVLFLQSYGVILFVIAGIADVWIDFRKLRQHPEKDSAPQR